LSDSLHCYFSSNKYNIVNPQADMADVPDLCKQFVHYLYRHIR